MKNHKKYISKRVDEKDYIQDYPITRDNLKEDLWIIVDNYWNRPNQNIEMMCEIYKVDFSYYMDLWLDEYNSINRKMYRKYGENVTLSEFRKAIMEDCLIYIWNEMGKNIRDFKIYE